MADLDPSIVEGMRKNRSAILRAMQQRKQTVVASLLGVDDATLCRWKDGVGGKPSDIDRLAALLAACGLIAQPTSNKSISAERLAALHVLAREALDAAPTSDFGALE